MYRLNTPNVQQVYLREDQKSAAQRPNHHASHEPQQYSLAAATVLPSHIFLPQQQQQQLCLESVDISGDIHATSENVARQKNQGTAVVDCSGGQSLTSSSSNSFHHQHHHHHHHPSHHHQHQHHLPHNNHQHNHRQPNVSDESVAVSKSNATAAVTVTTPSTTALTISCHSGGTLTSSLATNAEIVSNSNLVSTSPVAGVLTSIKTDAMYLSDDNKVQLLPADIKSEPLNEFANNLVISGGGLSSSVLPLVEDANNLTNGANIKKLVRRNLSISEGAAPPTNIKSVSIVSNINNTSVANKLLETSDIGQQPSSISLHFGGQHFTNVSVNDNNNGNGSGTSTAASTTNTNNGAEDLSEENLAFISNKRTKLDV